MEIMKRIWGSKPKDKVGADADATMWNTGIETPTTVLCGLLATKIAAYKIDPSSASVPMTFDFSLKTEENTTKTATKLRLVFTNHNAFCKVEILNKREDRMWNEEVTFTKPEQAVFEKARAMLAEQHERLNAAWKIEQNQNKALKLIEGLVDG